MVREEDMPIDIYYNKLQDWLIDRRHCNAKWQENASDIRKKINTAIQDMPENEEITHLLSGTSVINSKTTPHQTDFPNPHNFHLKVARLQREQAKRGTGAQKFHKISDFQPILPQWLPHLLQNLREICRIFHKQCLIQYINYFHCQRIIELLKECGEGNTNFFGKYSSKRMKDWQDIIQAYNQDNIYLAESAQMLMRNVNFEIPALKRQIAKCQQTQRECVRKENDCNTNCTAFKEKYLHTCKQMGIEGEDVRKELMQLVDKLPEIFLEITNKVKDLDHVVDYYREFVKFVAQNDATNIEDITPLIKFLILNGNATVYQWKTGDAPSQILKDEQKVDLDAMLSIADGNAEEEEGEIDWGLDDDCVDDGVADIDWGDGSIAVDEIEDINENVDLSSFTIEDAGQENPDGGIASGQEALSVMENTATRNVFIDELMEIEAFLEQRVIEMQDDADMITVKQFQSAPAIVQNQSTESLQKMLFTVNTILKELTSMKMQNLYLIQNSPRYVDRIADSLQQKLKISLNLKQQIVVLQERHQKALELQAETEPKLKLLVERTKELQKQMQTEISKRYKDRTVNIMGEINTI